MKLICFLIVLLLTGSLRAGDLASGFDSANKLYEEGKYPEAAAAYDKLIAAGFVSEALYFNRGNALFKLGRTGQAIASYRQARQLSRDPALRANLQFARTRARGGSAYRQPVVHRWLGLLTLNEWTWLAALALWAFFLLLALGEYRTTLKTAVRKFIVASAFAAVLFGICLAIVLSDYLAPTAIVITGEAEVRNGPLEESQSLFKVRDGMELDILDQKDGWLQVLDPAQRLGWLRQDQALVFEAGQPRKSKS